MGLNYNIMEELKNKANNVKSEQIKPQTLISMQNTVSNAVANKMGQENQGTPDTQAVAGAIEGQ